MSKKTAITSPKLSLVDAAKLIGASGHLVTYIVQGEMGIGKSALLNILKDVAGLDQHDSHYVDMTTKDVGDFLVPKMGKVEINGQDVDICKFVVNSEFGIHSGKPVIIMLDEIGKAKGAVLNACNRLMHERKLGEYTLHPDSIVFATTNLAKEGLGDVVPAHTRNRVTVLQVAKPSVDEWIDNFAVPNGVHPVVVSTVREYPQMFASDEEYEQPDQNPYIFDHRTPRAAFVTPRSMKRVSDILNSLAEKRIKVDPVVLHHAIAGTIGGPAAHELMTIYNVNNKLPGWADIIAAPESVEVPDNAVSLCLLAMRAVHNIEAATFPAWLTYMKRMPMEAQALFAKSVMNPKCPKIGIAATNAGFVQWCAQHSYLVSKV